jgi:cellulose synthase/poly-beta-1,6-N-acetylglucosamine synthase-like glycosyltransferase
MAFAAERARATWLRVTDADVVFAPDALARALRHARELNADHLVVFPTLLVHSLAERAMQSTLQVLATWGVRLWRVSDPRSRDFLGVGAFNLVRKKAYRAVGGFEATPMEVLEDVRLGWKLKRAGFRSEVALGPELVSIRWLSGALSVVRLIEKNAFAVSRFRPFLHVFASLALFAFAALPAADFVVAFIFSSARLSAGVAAVVTLLALLLAYRAHRRLTHAPAWMAVFFVPCVAVVAYAFFISMVLALARGGIIWRGTRYPLRDLRNAAGWW